jgi:hypothetical protein
MQAITSQHLAMQAITSQQQHLGCCNYMLHVLQQARNAAKQRIIEGLVCIYHPDVLLLLLELGVCCAVFAALLIFFICWVGGFRIDSGATRFVGNRIALTIDLKRRSR